MRKFLVSYRVRQGYGVFNETTDEIELDCKDSLSNGNLAKFITDYLRYKESANKIILYNFWEIIEQEEENEAN